MRLGLPFPIIVREHALVSLDSGSIHCWHLFICLPGGLGGGLGQQYDTATKLWLAFVCERVCEREQELGVKRFDGPISRCF